MPHPVSSSSSLQAPVPPAASARAAQADGDFAQALDAANFAAADDVAATDSSPTRAPVEPRSQAADEETAKQDETERPAARRGQTLPDVVLALALAPLAVPVTPAEGEAKAEGVAASTAGAPATIVADPQALARVQQPIVASPATNPAANTSSEPNATIEGVASLVGTADPDFETEPGVSNPSKTAPDAGAAAAKPSASPSGTSAHQAAAVAVAAAAPATQGVVPDPLAPTAPETPVATADPAAATASDGASADAGGGEEQKGAGGQTHGSEAAEADTPATLQNSGAAASSSSSSSAVLLIDAAAARPAPSAATAAPTTPQATAALASAVVSNAIAAATAGLKRTRFEAQLDGSDLGRIDVRLDIGRGGRVGAKLTVDSAEARDLLQNDARALQRTLEQAGFRLPEGGFTVEVRSGGANAGDPQARREPAGGSLDANETDLPIGRDAAPIAYRPLRAAASALDVRV
ncbi:flagellar hook-length control protein FliK [Methylopila sp. Yamaguchi]|uniref:flagellar hook-length control protein FliK n=1 Tax=Methylopila sp. Yamaguchi TaxID=1437817 RepID=UPI000CAE8050|nr:flagellar hook-length control protein FliK [Methylopila sp. Yamaguchi]GBD48259.1 hypothetical protein METY_1472 [Methylopila sp. Yamaguchi]